ncbi:Chemotaxis protein methyltransferase [Dyadobacter sp. CECT 9275]|uniref:Chemotaxis protein methyltransferase n=1 Tax=Dyadobacter helix TaxID=2822344 RepID=A0A916N3V5_9BACT|nr:CheR family methyltransferase [Dyadobacter sp. CECT 9275]CAG4997958.1 Chemotaxis protein methyltransferase [Dyadobacter sp. CECT 9275]
MTVTGIETNDLEVLISHIRHISGFDFSGYSRPSLLRRVSRYMTKHAVDFTELLGGLSEGGSVVYDFIQELTVNYTEMFRDVDFFLRVRGTIFPYLESYPTLRIWTAGCASGEEPYSVGILLKEAGLYDRSFIYATDISNRVLNTGREGIFNMNKMRGFSENYLLSGGTHSLSDYYRVLYGKAVMIPELRKNIVFSIHDLTGDGVFNEFHLIFCRNVLIYFTLEQRRQVFLNLYKSLAIFGFLCIGKRESFKNSGIEEHFKIIDSKLNIYQKIS